MGQPDWLCHFAQIILERAPSEPELRQQIAPQVGRAAEPVVIFWPLQRGEPLPDVVELGVKRRTAGRRRLDTGQRRTNLCRSLRAQFVRPLEQSTLGRPEQLERIRGQHGRKVRKALLVVRHGRERVLKGDGDAGARTLRQSSSIGPNAQAAQLTLLLWR